MDTYSISISISIFSIVIALISVAFAGAKWYMANKEQVLRLRPIIYLHKPEQVISNENFKISCSMTNVGILPAKVIQTTGYEILPTKDKDFLIDKSAIEAMRTPSIGDREIIIVPNQSIVVHPFVLTPRNLGEAIFAGKITLQVKIRIDYKDFNRKFFYWLLVEFDPVEKSWNYIDGDAN
jgi:hypothetical protein